MISHGKDWSDTSQSEIKSNDVKQQLVHLL